MTSVSEIARPVNQTIPPAPVGNANVGICSLTLRVGGTRYAIKPIARVDVRAFRLRKINGKQVYYVSQLPEGWQTCTCPDYIYRQRACKHVRALRALGIIDAVPDREQVDADNESTAAMFHGDAWEG